MRIKLDEWNVLGEEIQLASDDDVGLPGGRRAIVIIRQEETASMKKGDNGFILEVGLTQDTFLVWKSYCALHPQTCVFDGGAHPRKLSLRLKRSDGKKDAEHRVAIRLKK